MKKYARSVNGQPPDTWQEYCCHSDGVYKLAEEFTRHIGCENIGKAIGILHDIGKLSPRWQTMIYNCNGYEGPLGFLFKSDKKPIISHANAGASYAYDDDPCCKAIAYVVAGHHTGLPDIIPNEASYAGETLKYRVEKGNDDLKLISAKDMETIESSLPEISIPDYVTPKNFHLWTRMLMSCLVDADYLDSERFKKSYLYEMRGKYKTLAELHPYFDDYIKQFRANAKTKPINEIRDHVFSACVNAAKGPPGIYSLTAPTGSGKTYSAMAFALEHAKKYSDKRRIIYIAPYTSIIEQTSEIFFNIFGLDQVVEHHSNISDDRIKDTRMSLASDNWDAPIIVTTSVQFFNSLMSHSPRQCRKLHNIANSIVIMDEAQMIPVEKLIPCLSLMHHLVESFNVTILMATATLPAFSDLPEGLKHRGLKNVMEIPLESQKMDTLRQRVKYHLPTREQGVQTIHEVADELLDHKVVLCIVNRRNDCRSLYQAVQERSPKGTFHLSALMCGEHRSDVIKSIKERLADKDSNEPTRIISTSLIESGVDLNFPSVYREITGIDSIIQAAGRSNREGDAKHGHVHVFSLGGYSGSDVGLRISSTRNTLDVLDDLNNPGIITKYFENYYASTENFGGHFVKLLESKSYDVFFRAVGESFRMIDDEGPMLPVIVRYKNVGHELAINMEDDKGSWKYQRYIVNAPRKKVESMLKDGRLIYGEKAQGIIFQGTAEYNAACGFVVG